MWYILLNDKIVDTILGWDENDALVFASRRYGLEATVRRVPPEDIQEMYRKAVEIRDNNAA